MYYVHMCVYTCVRYMDFLNVFIMVVKRAKFYISQKLKKEIQLQLVKIWEWPGDKANVNVCARFTGKALHIENKAENYTSYIITYVSSMFSHSTLVSNRSTCTLQTNKQTNKQINKFSCIKHQQATNMSASVNEQAMNHSSPRPKCYAKSPTVQDVFQPIPGVISCAGVTGRWGLLSHTQNAVRWLALFKRSVLFEGIYSQSQHASYQRSKLPMQQVTNVRSKLPMQQVTNAAAASYQRSKSKLPTQQQQVTNAASYQRSRESINILHACG